MPTIPLSFHRRTWFCIQTFFEDLHLGGDAVKGRSLADMIGNGLGSPTHQMDHWIRTNGADFKMYHESPFPKLLVLESKVGIQTVFMSGKLSLILKNN
jgi:hypothetical protein